MLLLPTVGAADTISLTGTIRDFKGTNEPGGHPDFENRISGVVTGIVGSTLGADGKPVYVSPGGTAGATHGAAAFNQWYNNARVSI